MRRGSMGSCAHKEGVVDERGGEHTRNLKGSSITVELRGFVFRYLGLFFFFVSPIMA